MALFKIFNNIDSQNLLPNTYTKGYMYFDAVTGVFYIDTAGDGGSTGTRIAVNAKKTWEDENGDRILTTYLKISDAQDIISGTAQRVAHTLTFGAGGAYVYDGSEDVVVPVYTGGVA